MHTKFWTLLQSPIRVQTKTVILHQLEISNMIFTCYLWYIMHQHILYSRFQSDRRARAATACSLHCQFDYPSFPKEKKIQISINYKKQHGLFIQYAVNMFNHEKKNILIKTPILNISTIILHCWSNTSLQQLFNHCHSFWVALYWQALIFSYWVLNAQFKLVKIIRE